jgi:anti-sigma B factor antagonist
MNFSRTDEGNGSLVRIDGELDAVTAPQLRAPFDALVAEGRDPITIDLAQLRLIDSSGVGAIVSLYKRARANGGKVKIVGVSDQPAAIFKLLRLDRVFAEDAQ